MARPFQTLMDMHTQIEHDQTLFESELGGELQGHQHEELVQEGAEMLKAIKEFINMGITFAEQQPHGFIPTLTKALEDYLSLLLPPKVCGGFCPCLKPARSGPEYDKRFFLVRAQVDVAVFMARAVVIEGVAEKLNIESVRYSEYSAKMNNLFNSLSIISTRGNDAAREEARGELLAALEMISRFLKSYEEETEGFRTESKRRLASMNELLNSR
jgi:hypothetical protein